MRTDNRRGSLISFYAAGIGVMFLLFSSVGGAGGALLDEVEAGHARAVLSTNVGMTGAARRQVAASHADRLRAADGDVPLGPGRVRARRCSRTCPASS